MGVVAVYATAYRAFDTGERVTDVNRHNHLV
jgi:hypothetical protein